MAEDPTTGVADATMDLLALRKAATLVHWVRGLHLVLSQSTGPTIGVTCDESLTFEGTPLVLHPCEFREQVVRLMASEEVGLGPSFGLGQCAVHIGILTSPGTELDSNGLVVTQVDDEHHAVLHAAAGSAGPRLAGTTTAVPSSCAWPLDGVPVLESVDAELDTVLLSCGYQIADVERGRQGYCALFDAMIACAAEEVTMLLGS